MSSFSWRPSYQYGRKSVSTQYITCFTGSIIATLACRSGCAMSSFYPFKDLNLSFYLPPPTTIYRSRGHLHSVCNHPDLKTHFHPKGRMKKAKDDRASMQPAKSLHEQTESPRELCRPAKKGEPLGFGRKGNIRTKMAKKKSTAIVNIIWKGGWFWTTSLGFGKYVLGAIRSVLLDTLYHKTYFMSIWAPGLTRI